MYPGSIRFQAHARDALQVRGRVKPGPLDLTLVLRRVSWRQTRRAKKQDGRGTWNRRTYVLYLTRSWLIYYIEFFAGSDSLVFIPDRVRPSGAVPWDRSVEIHANAQRSAAAFHRAHVCSVVYQYGAVWQC